ncbi:aminotransferase class V-fold PLP-dependent enzyme [Lysobacter maris]|uniref:Aminotransferase class V-fold PLP-dependent enzyme n=1 Tax=Marilutibacter maris TaxID=1605891 RepID=A0A508AEA6_9GAMM|nr:aminotransferase class V-fold PLP-dependent enzyme [Lysobacter maris]KAB8178856.1 aminotransferase class V-fold PLP-dependent enzyme [Lysobacter maris]
MPLSDHDALTDLFATPPGTLYLDSAAHGPRLCSVHSAAEAALADGVAPWRIDMDDWYASIERVRTLAAMIFEGDGFRGDGDGVALVPSVGYAMSLAANNLELDAGDTVLVLEGQFPSNLLPWQQRCAQTGAGLVAVRRAHGQDWTAAVLAALDADPAIRILALPHAHWHDGALLDLDRISARAQARDAALVLDMSQSLGALPADIARWRPQFVAAVGHKWLLGSHGLAYLWAAPHWRAHGQPLEQNWFAREHAAAMASPSQPPPYRAGARRFDAGGVAHAQKLAMAAAALSQLQDWGIAALSQALGARTAAFDAVLREHGLEDWGTPGHAPHLFGLRPAAQRLDAVAHALADAGAVFTQRHGVLRIAPHLQVTPAQMRMLAERVVAAAQ